MNTTVVNIKYDKCDVYIGRPSKWGNPFIIGQDGNRSEVITKYRNWIIKQPIIDDLHELQGQKLGCWCKPKLCHGDVLVELIDDLNHSILSF